MWPRDQEILNLTEDSILSIQSLLVVLFPSALFRRDCHRREIVFNFYDLMQDVGILLSVPPLLQSVCNTCAHQRARILLSVLPT